MRLRICSFECDSCAFKDIRLSCLLANFQRGILELVKHIIWNNSLQKVPSQMFASIHNTTLRSSRPEVFCKKGVLRNFAKFTGKNLCQILTCLRVSFYSIFSKFLSFQLISGSNTKAMKSINEAFEQYRKYTCIRFVQRTNQPQYVEFHKGGGLVTKFIHLFKIYSSFIYLFFHLFISVLYGRLTRTVDLVRFRSCETHPAIWVKLCIILLKNNILRKFVLTVHRIRIYIVLWLQYQYFCFESFSKFHRLVFSRFLDLGGNLGIVKEKPTRKTCFSREKKRIASPIYQAKFCMAAFL